MERTIAAIATPAGAGGIAIIRLSGSDAVDIAASVFSAPERLKSAPTHTIHYGFIVDGDERIDDTLRIVTAFAGFNADVALADRIVTEMLEKLSVVFDSRVK